VFTDFYIANRSEAEVIAHSEEDHWPLLTLHGITDFELIDLSKLLRGGKHHHPALAYGDEESEMYVLLMEPELVSLLANLREPEMIEVASAWGESEGFAGAAVAEVQAALGSLVKFARASENAQLQILYVTAV
jgi:hypothetical protein